MAKKQDARKSEVPLGERVSLNLTAPPRYTNMPEFYYPELRKTNAARGDVVLRHHFKTKATGNPFTNTYTLGHAFVSLIMEHKNALVQRRINLGGIACPTCTRVHRLDRYALLEKDWKANPTKFDKKQLDEPVTSRCDGSKDDDKDDAVFDDEDDDEDDTDADVDDSHRLASPELECTQGGGIKRLAAKFEDISWEDLEALAFDEYLTLFTTPAEVLLGKIFWKRFLAPSSKNVK